MTRGHSTSKFHDKFAFKLKIKNIQKVHRKFFFFRIKATKRLFGTSKFNFESLLLCFKPKICP